MKRNTIYVLVVLMSLGMIGIISIQYFWIKNAMDLRRVQFNRSVMAAMNEVTHKLQKIQAIKHFERINSIETELNIDSTGNVHFSYVDDANDLVFIGDQDSSVKFTDGKLELQVKYNNEFEQGEIDDSSNVYILEDTASNQAIVKVKVQEFNENLQKKYLIYEQLLNDINEFESNARIEERVDVEMLYEELNTAFQSRGLNTDFSFGIVSIRNKEESVFFETEDPKEISNVNQSLFKVNMFPGDPFDQNYLLSVYFPNLRSNIFQSLGLLLSLSTLFILIVIGVFIATIKTIFRQKKLSDIKNDFISNMTHELKTPISTISLACEVLEDKSIAITGEKHDSFIGMIRSENNRLAVLVEKVLRNATLETGELSLKGEQIELNKVIEDLNQFDLHIRKLGGKLIKELSIENPVIIADRVHLLNVISNLIDNAIKYSNEPPHVTIRTIVDQDFVKIEVEDQGIGISKDYIQKIFEKFFRVPTGNVHNVKGFGLGLSYVWDVTNRTGGSVNVQSELNKGSKFTLNIPLAHE